MDQSLEKNPVLYLQVSLDSVREHHVSPSLGRLDSQHAATYRPWYMNELVDGGWMKMQTGWMLGSKLGQDQGCAEEAVDLGFSSICLSFICWQPFPIWTFFSLDSKTMWQV